MNKRYLALAGLGLALAVGAVSCVSTQKTADRGIASISDNIIQIFKDNMENNSMIFGAQNPAKRLSSEEVRQLSSSSKLNLTNAEVLIDNDASFESKIQMIRSAKKEIRMVYYIYADDDSTSFLTRELIQRAQAGVKIKLLVDLFTNYGKMDLFAMMVKEGQGNIDVRFYNYPSERIISDSKYMTLPCPKVEVPAVDTCQKFKSGVMKATAMQKSTVFSEMLLAGIYSRNMKLLKIAIGFGAQINLEDYQKNTADEQSLEKIFDFSKLLVEAKMKKDVHSYLKLQIALALYANDLNPLMNELTGRLPIGNDAIMPGKKITRIQEWEHLTDYTHHKLLAVDGKQFQLGGRNLEDSYHMKSRLGDKGKYIFMDTDFRAETVSGGALQIEKSFDEMFKFSEMVADLSSVQKIMPFDLTSNSEALEMAASVCVQEAQAGQIPAEKLGSCIQDHYLKMPNFVNQSTRLAKVKYEMNASAENYLANYEAAGKKVFRDNWRKENSYSPSSDDLSPNDLKTVEVYYIENTPFDLNAQDKIRRVGSRIGAEDKFHKNIHALWYRGLENVCKASRDEQQDKRIILHTAYLFMPSGMIHRIAKMLNGDYGDCSRVRLTFLTNSFQTTDLNIINVFARYQMIQLFKHYGGMVAYEKSFNETGFKYKRWFPTLDYFEYNASSVGTGVSLHSKLSLLGDDMIIGSANADVRSYYMDTNNGVFIRNAKELNRDYTAYIDEIITDKKKSSDWTNKFAAYTPEMVQAENKFILAAVLKRYDKKGRVNDKMKKVIQSTVDRLGQKITDSTYRLLNFRSEFSNDFDQNGRNLEVELNKVANDFDDLFKLL